MNPATYQQRRQELLARMDKLREIGDDLVSRDPLFINGLPVDVRQKLLLLDRESVRLRNPDHTIAFVGGLRAREEIKRYFHGKCLNVEGFVSYICSTGFTERLGRCATTAEREACFLEAFCSRVVTEAEILNQVTVIAGEVGSELDTAWSSFCAHLALHWNTRIQGQGTRFSGDHLGQCTDGLILAELEQARQLAASAGQVPAVGTTIGKVGESAVLLLPLIQYRKVGLMVGLPVFFILAAKRVWDFIMARLDDRRRDTQAAISGRLALLGQRVGAEFEREIRQRLTDLHIRRERAIRTMVARVAEERVGVFGGVA